MSYIPNMIDSGISFSNGGVYVFVFAAFAAFSVRFGMLISL